MYAVFTEVNTDESQTEAARQFLNETVASAGTGTRSDGGLLACRGRRSRCVRRHLRNRGRGASIGHPDGGWEATQT